MAQVFTMDNFETEVLKAEQTVLVDFYADWCGPCKMMAPVVDKLADMYAGKIKVGKLNIDQAEDLAEKYAVMTIPTLIVFKNGEVVERFTGVQDQKTLTAVLDQNI